MKSIVAGAVLALAAAGAAAPASAALLDGKTLQMEYLYPDLSSVYVPAQDVTGGAPGVTIFIGSNFTVTLGDHTINARDDDFVGGYYNPTMFNGLHIWDAYDTVADFTGVSLFHNQYPGFDMSRVTFDANNIFINFTGLNFAVNPSELEIGVAGGAPEAATWAMMIAGFGLAGATLRRRRAVSSAA